MTFKSKCIKTCISFKLLANNSKQQQLKRNLSKGLRLLQTYRIIEIVQTHNFPINSTKQREDSKSMIVLMNGEKMMYSVFSQIPDLAWDLWDLSEKPTTLILDNPRNISENLIAADKTLGVRIIKEPFCFKLLERMKKPLVSTSANISGMPTPKTFKEISPEIIKGVDYVVNLHRDKVCKNPSTIIKLSLDNQVKVIRK